MIYFCVGHLLGRFQSNFSSTVCIIVKELQLEINIPQSTSFRDQVTQTRWLPPSRLWPEVYTPPLSTCLVIFPAPDSPSEGGVPATALVCACCCFSHLREQSRSIYSHLWGYFVLPPPSHTSLVCLDFSFFFLPLLPVLVMSMSAWYQIPPIDFPKPYHIPALFQSCWPVNCERGKMCVHLGEPVQVSL